MPGPLAVELTQATIETLLHNSTRLPVLVVFFSSRSEASTALADNVVQLAREAGGRFQVALGDADAHPELVQTFGVRGVPAVLAMLRGQIAPLFEGVPGEGELVGVVNQVLAAAAQGGLTGTVAFADDAYIASTTDTTKSYWIDTGYHAGPDFESGTL